MVETSRGRSWTASVVALVLTAVVAAPPLVSAQSPPAGEVQAQAQAPATPPAAPTETQTQGPAAVAAVGEEKGPNTGRISVLLGVDWASAYYFRGIVNTQNGGDNVQPYGEVGFRLLENLGPLTSLTFAPGIWSNFHWGGGLVVEPSDPRFWYEADLYLKLTATLWEIFTTSVTYTYYVSPNDSFRSYSDVGLAFALNDSKWFGGFAFNPSILFAFETSGEALTADGKKGIYMGLGLAPSYTFFDGSKFPLTVSAPMTFGFSLKDYYTVNGNNQTFGYFSGGPLLTLGLKVIPPAWGSWALRGGVQFLVLNSNLKAVNGGDNFVPIGSVGLSVTY
ncbi:MAG: hypothetical protein L0027_01980 [Candidatus Rokubacteria bacterium]|nr:hypothetical protein [Candidatus Rokubacteria bacterium]